MTCALIPLAEGVEEMEAVIAADTLRRAGWQVILAGLTPDVVTGSRQIKLYPDMDLNEVDPDSIDIIVLPGGAGGAARLEADERIVQLLQRFLDDDKWIAAICAAPAVVLYPTGILSQRRATCYPSLEEGLTGTDWCQEAVVVDGHIVTSRGPGTAFEFALTLIRLIDGDTAADKVGSGMLIR